MFVGFVPQIMRDAPFYAVFFGGYELNCYIFPTYTPWMPDELNYFEWRLCWNVRMDRGNAL
jgi:hypothetical protein